MKNENLIKFFMSSHVTNDLITIKKIHKYMRSQMRRTLEGNTTDYNNNRSKSALTH